MSAALLPQITGDLSQVLADLWDSNGRYAPLIGTVKNYGLTITPDDWVPWFIYDYGLEDVVPYVRDYRRVLAEGPAWQARRGTPRGIEIGIGWVGSAGTVAPGDGRHDWWKFQIGFERPATDLEQIRQLDGIIRLSKASEDELFRMFSPARDYRPVRMDRHRADDGGTYDAYSGEQLWEGGPLISFGWGATLELDAGVLLTSSTEIETTSQIAYFSDGMRYDRDRFGGRTAPIVTGDTEVEASSDIVTRRDAWPSTWPRGSWATASDTTSIPTPLEIS